MIELNFTEIEPLGPQLAGDSDEAQIHDSWGRRFTAEFTGDQTYWAVVEITFYQVQLGDGSCILFREAAYSICSNPHDVGTSEEWSDSDYFEHSPGDAANDKLAFDACKELTLSEISWPAKHQNKIEIWRQI